MDLDYPPIQEPADGRLKCPVCELVVDRYRSVDRRDPETGEWLAPVTEFFPCGHTANTFVAIWTGE